ncbi:MAG: hypothetical protein LBK61_12590 [Spirochaetaceae bacterium]|nr:hypothetical protein [Spirochaetaceae bacterium]
MSILPLRSAPAGGENPIGFSSLRESLILAENQRRAGVPLRGAKTLRVFIPLRIISDANPVPS